MAEESTKEGDSDIDLYCDLDETENGSKANEDIFDCNGTSIPNISTLFSENECKVFFSEDGKDAKIKIKKQVDSNVDATVSQPVVKDLDLFTDVVAEKFVQAEQEKLERESLMSQNIELKKLNSQLEAELNAVMNKNRTLMKNICALYKTAKEEISRKDALIADLREKNDRMIFRRKRFWGAGAGPVRQSKFRAVTADAQRLNGTNSEPRTSAISNEELHCIYSDYQRALDIPKPGGENSEKPNFSASEGGNFNTGNMSCNSEEVFAARNNLFKKLLSYERQPSLQESERKQKNAELKRIISSSTNVEDFTQLYSKYLARWALSAGDTNTLSGTSGLDDSGECVACDGENDSNYPGEGNYEEGDEDYEYYRAPKYVGLDRPNGYFHCAPRKGCYDHLMEEKVRQVQTYGAKDYQTSSCSVNYSMFAKQCDAEKFLSASQVPEALKDDSLKLFSYRGKPVPIAVKKKVLGYAKSPKKTDVEKSEIHS